MKLLITYASAGTGHKHSAEALYRYIKKYHPEIDVKITDILKFTNPNFNFFYSIGYSFVAKHLPKLWGFFYGISGNSTSLFLSNKIRFAINRLNDDKFAKFLKKEQFDVIVASHFFPAEVAGFLKKHNKIKSSIISIITDFAVHPFWINSQVASFIVALPETKNDLIRNGVPEEKIKVLGIPIDEQFTLQKNKKDLMEKLLLNSNKFTVLISIGMIGAGPITKIIGAIDKDAQILVVCGKNYNLCRKLKRKNYSNVFVYGLVSNMDELMSVADIIITKAGGLTIVESITKNIPLVFIPIIGGQEFCNAQILKNHKACFIAKNVNELKDAISLCKNNPQIVNDIKSQLEKIKKIAVLKDVTDEICANYPKSSP